MNIIIMGIPPAPPTYMNIKSHVWCLLFLFIICCIPATYYLPSVVIMVADGLVPDRHMNHITHIATIKQIMVERRQWVGNPLFSLSLTCSSSHGHGVSSVYGLWREFIEPVRIYASVNGIITGLHNGLSSVWHRAIIWTNAALLSIGL